MNLQEFSKLNVGDKIEYPAASAALGTVVECTPSGVHVVWGEVMPNATRFFFSVTGTAWFGWTKVENAQEHAEAQPAIDSGSSAAG